MNVQVHGRDKILHVDAELPLRGLCFAGGPDDARNL